MQNPSYQIQIKLPLCMCKAGGIRGIASGQWTLLHDNQVRLDQRHCPEGNLSWADTQHKHNAHKTNMHDKSTRCFGL